MAPQLFALKILTGLILDAELCLRGASQARSQQRGRLLHRERVWCLLPALMTMPCRKRWLAFAPNGPQPNTSYVDTQLPPLLLLLRGAAGASPLKQMLSEEQTSAPVLASSFVSIVQASESWTGQGVAVLGEAVGVLSKSTLHLASRLQNRTNRY